MPQVGYFCSMAMLRRISSKINSIDNSGFGTNGNMYGGRFYTKNGRANFHKVGLSFMEGTSWFHTLLQMSRSKFLLVIFCGYLFINLLFASLYLAVGIEKLSGMVAYSPIEKFGEAFFFSAQTFTTVGYGRLAPTGFLMSFVASVEALLGLLGFAVATGLMYGRFSRPRAYLKFSQNAIIAPFKEGVALMLRLVPYKNNSLTDVEAKVTLGMAIEENGVATNKFYNLILEMEKINSLSLNWTIVHPIDEESPFYGLSKNDLIIANAELIVYVKAFDDYFSNTVVDRTSYKAEEMNFGYKFVPMYHKDEKNGTTLLDLNKLNNFLPADISFSNMVKWEDNPLNNNTA